MITFKEYKKMKLEEMGGNINFAEPVKASPDAKSKEHHREIHKLWKKFMQDASRLGYVIAPRHTNDKIVLRHKKFTPNDLTGHYTLAVNKGKK